ncbi:MAG: serine/threonine protein kinase [Blautia sp.]|nr:serine/threonine protein kinase [Blautia sp.]
MRQTNTGLCLACMRELPEGTTICPSCGYDSRKYVPKQEYLRPLELLHGKYRIGRCLGQGGFGITYTALDEDLMIRTAVKELFIREVSFREEDRRTVGCVAKDRALFEENRKRFLQEARILAMIRQHEEEGIVGVREHFEENGTAYLVMEFLDGTTVKEICRQKQPDPETICRWMKPVARALTRLHQFGVVHGDISPDNIMLLRDGRVRLLDFGGAYVKGERMEPIVSFKRGYTAEEQYGDRGNIGPWTDVYAFAATLYYCLMGNPPPDAIQRKRGLGMPSLPRRTLKIRKSEEAALFKGLAVEPEDRYQTIEDFWNAFDRRRKRPYGKALLLTVAALLAFSAGYPPAREKIVERVQIITRAEDIREESMAETPAEPSEEKAEDVKEQRQDLSMYREGDPITDLGGTATLVSAMDGSLVWAVSQDPSLAEPEMILWTQVWDETQQFDIVPQEDGSCRIRQHGETERWLELEPDYGRLLLREAEDNERQHFRIFYGGYGLCLLQCTDGRIIGYSPGENEALGISLTARAYEDFEDSRLEKWRIDFAGENLK